jgi:hypothetical protein
MQPQKQDVLPSDLDQPQPGAASAALQPRSTSQQHWQQQQEAADPWSVLQSQYASADRSTEVPSSSMKNIHITAAAMTAKMPDLGQKNEQLEAAAVGNAPVAGSAGALRHSAGEATLQQHRHELVLDEDEDDHVPPGDTDDNSNEAGRGKQMLAMSAEASSRFAVTAEASGLSSSSNHSEQGMQHPVPVPVTAAVKRPGGWGGGALASAGTLMLGDEPSAGRYGTLGGTSHHATSAAHGSSNKTVAAVTSREKDSVFGDDDEDEEDDEEHLSMQGGAVDNMGRPGHQAHAADDGNGSRQQHSTRVSISGDSSRGSSGSGRHGDSHHMHHDTVPTGSRSSRAQLHAGSSSSSSSTLKAATPAAAVYEQALVEELDDVDAMIEAELEAQHALPEDVAAKLAQFEALADEDDEI